ncbi:hypothetical protein AAMO2058_000647100 [Amorphochlora amoebiformis]
MACHTSEPSLIIVRLMRRILGRVASSAHGVFSSSKRRFRLKMGAAVGATGVGFGIWRHVSMAEEVGLEGKNGFVMRAHAETTPEKKPKMGSEKPTVVIIGMRGAGKTTLSSAAGSSLGLRVIDVDYEIEQDVKTDIKVFIHKYGWKAFRDTETRVFKRVLYENPTGAIIACGGGIVVTPENRRILKQQPRVVEIVRHIEDIVAYLELDKTRPAYAIQSTRNTYAERIPWFDECAKWHFVIGKGDRNWKSTEEDFAALLRLIQNGRLTSGRFR